jgi:PAS domain S-box-containing protein
MKCRIGLDGYWQKVPSRFCEMLGYTEEELKKHTFTEICHPDDREAGNAIAQKIKRGDLREFEIEKRYLTKSQESIWVYVNGALIKNDKGDPQYVICYIHDISERKQAQKKLKESKQRFKSLFKHNPHPVYYFDLEGNFQGVNEKLVEFTGYSREELLGGNYESFIVEKDLEQAKKQFQKAASGIPGEYEIQVVVKDNERRDIRVTKFPMYVGDEVVGVFGILQDITEQKRARRKLEESEKHWQRLVKNNPQPVQIVQDGRIVFINQVGAELYGASEPDALLGRSIDDFGHPDTIAEVEKRKQKLEKQKNIEPSVIKIKRLDDLERYIEVHSIPIIYKNEVAIQTVLHDVTDQKEKEQVIKDSLDEKEMLLKEIHHRIKNNLAVISGLLELQAMNTDDKFTLDTLRDSQLRIHSIAMIHEKLYQSEALSDIGFDMYLKELVESISQTYNTLDHTIDIDFDLQAVSLDLDQAIPCSLIVNEIIVNSYKHAFNSIENGKIKIVSQFDDPELTIQIEDNGQGLPKNFDINAQQSLGMTLVQTLARQLEGEIDLSSKNGRGTTFELRFDID